MVAQKDMDAILKAGIAAPSGDNSQPWRFETGDSHIDLHDIPERDTSLYNYRQRASLVAHGACIENMQITARTMGYAVEIEYFPTPGNQRHVARLILSPAEPEYDPLATTIPERTINRKLYRGGALTEENVHTIYKSAEATGTPECAVRLLQNEEKQIAADVASLSDRLVFENPLLHGFLFEHIRWTAEGAVNTGDGLDVRTLELAPLDRILFPLLKHYPLVNFVRMFGATRIIAANARRLMLSASAAGVITIADTSSVVWLNAGRQLERVWLEATRQGMSFHLMTGITLLVQKVREGDMQGLDGGNLKVLKRADALLSGLGGGKAVALLFRIGMAPPPTVRSLRIDLEKVVRRPIN